MIHNYVNRPGSDSHGSWSVAKASTGISVLVQITVGMNQTRVALAPATALQLATDLAAIAAHAMEGVKSVRPGLDEVWLVETGVETASGITDEVVLHLYDADGGNNDRKTTIALPVLDVLDVVREIFDRSLQIARALRADALSRQGRSPV